MTKQLLDAVTTAKSIHDGDYSSLCDKSFVVCDNKKKKRRGKHVKKPKEEKMTLAKLAKEMRDGFKQVNSRIDNLEKDVKNINARLDYNGLKKLPNNR